MTAYSHTAFHCIVDKCLFTHSLVAIHDLLADQATVTALPTATGVASALPAPAGHWARNFSASASPSAKLLLFTA